MDKFSNKPFAEALRDFKPEVKKQFAPGKYIPKAKFNNRKGEPVEVEIHPITLDQPSGTEELERQTKSWASSLGLHNFGMDVYVGRYPDGHPVEFTITSDKGEVVHSFVQVFNASGYPVEEKK